MPRGTDRSQNSASVGTNQVSMVMTVILWFTLRCAACPHDLESARCWRYISSRHVGTWEARPKTLRTSHWPRKYSCGIARRMCEASKVLRAPRETSMATRRRWHAHPSARAHGCTATSGIVKYCRRRFCVRWVGKPRAIQLIATALRRTICRIWWESAKLSQTWERQSWHSSSVAASVCLVCGRSNLGMYVHRRWPRGFTGLHQRRRIGTCTRLYGGLVDSQASTSARSIY